MRLTHIILLCVLSGPARADDLDTWDFLPTKDSFSGAAILDLSYLNEKKAGETGFVRRSADGAAFVRGDGKPIRFWAVNTQVADLGMAGLRDHARFLAKRGVNMVRFHGQMPNSRQYGVRLQSIDEKEREKLWQLIAAMSEEGIYVTVSPYYPHSVTVDMAKQWHVPRDSPSLTGMIYFDPVLQNAYKAWLREILLPVNPHTGVALKDDPALAIIQMQNEDSLLFWTLNSIQGREASLLAVLFGQFLKEKYGSLTRAEESWAGIAVSDSIGGVVDDWELGVIALSSIWHLTRDSEDANIRLSDQTEFLTLTMRNWHAEISQFLSEEIGSVQLFNAGNWRTADDLILDDLERYSYTTGDVIGINRYATSLHEGRYRGWAIVAGDKFREEGVLKRPLDFPATLRQPVGYPYIVSETLWAPPMWQQAEGPILMAAYQALTGVDISFWFTSHHAQWRDPQSANGYLPSIGKWVLNTPNQIGAFPAAALIFRLGLVAEAPPIILEHRDLHALWARERPMISTGQGVDLNRDPPGVLANLYRKMTRTENRTSPLSFLVGPVLASFDSRVPDYIHPQLDRFIDSKNKVVSSVTQELRWDWGNGVVTLNAPRVQGAVGALSAISPIVLQDVTITSDAGYASIVVVPLDGQVISESKRLFIQINSVARPTGWTAKPIDHPSGDAMEVVAFGTAPWQIDTVEAELIIENRILSKATVLDANGMADGMVEFKRNGSNLELKLPEDALYVVFE